MLQQRFLAEAPMLTDGNKDDLDDFEDDETVIDDN